jgi:hypothetical protein
LNFRNVQFGRIDKKGRVAFQERRVLRFEVFWGKTTIRMTTTNTITTGVRGKGKGKKERG